MEKHIPYFNKLEKENKKLMKQLNTKSDSIKLVEKLQKKVIDLEKKLANSKSDHEKQIRKLVNENQQQKERLDTVTKMNISLKKKMDAAKKKADQYDTAIEKMIQLEHDKQELVSLFKNNQAAAVSESASAMNVLTIEDARSHMADGENTAMAITPSKVSAGKVSASVSQAGLSGPGSTYNYGKKEKVVPMTVRGKKNKNPSGFLKGD